MKLTIFGAAIIIAVLIGCGTTKEEEKKKLDANTVSLNPAPGTYNYKPWVIMTKKDDGIGSGVMYVKGPGESEFSSATFDCLNSPYASGSEASKQGYCKQITQSGTLTWYLENSEAKSEEKSAEYVISLENYNISGQSKATIDAAPEAIEFIEKETFCEYSGDNKLEVVVQMQQEAKLTTARYAYLYFTLENPVSGTTVNYNKENSIEAGVDVKPVSDPVPSFIFSPSYTSKPSTVDSQQQKSPINRSSFNLLW